MSEENEACTAAYNAGSSPAWTWLFPAKCKSCSCDRRLRIPADQSEACDRKACGSGMQCVNGACECNFGYRRLSGSDVNAGCIWNVQLSEPETLQEEWKRGEKVNITWLATGTATVRIDLLRDTGSGHRSTIAASLTRQTPNVGLFEWTVPTTLAVSNETVEYFVQISANHDYRAKANASVSIVYGESEYLPGPIISPAKYSVVRAVGNIQGSGNTLRNNEAHAVRIQWRPPAVARDQQLAMMHTLVMIKATSDQTKTQPVIVSKVDLMSGTMVHTLPDLPGIFVPTPVRLAFRDGDGKIAQQSEGPVFLLEPSLPSITIDALLVREDAKTRKIHFAIDLTSTGIRDNEALTLQMLDREGKVLHEVEIANARSANIVLDLDAVKDEWDRLVVRGVFHSEAWGAITKGGSGTATTTTVTTSTTTTTTTTTTATTTTTTSTTPTSTATTPTAVTQASTLAPASTRDAASDDGTEASAGLDDNTADDTKANIASIVVPIVLILLIGIGIIIFRSRGSRKAEVNVVSTESPPQMDAIELDDIGASSAEEQGEPSEYLEVLTTDVNKAVANNNDEDDEIDLDAMSIFASESEAESDLSDLDFSADLEAESARRTALEAAAAAAAAAARAKKEAAAAAAAAAATAAEAERRRQAEADAKARRKKDAKDAAAAAAEVESRRKKDAKDAAAAAEAESRRKKAAEDAAAAAEAEARRKKDAEDAAAAAEAEARRKKDAEDAAAAAKRKAERRRKADAEAAARRVAQEEAEARLAALRARPPPRRLKRADKEKLFTIFAALDTDGDSSLSKEELKAGLSGTELHSILEAYKVDADELAELLDEDGSGGVSVLEFINGIVEVVNEHAELADAAVAKALETAASVPPPTNQQLADYDSDASSEIEI